MPSTPNIGRTRHALKVPRVSPVTDDDHLVNWRHIEQAINALPLYSGATATSTSDEASFTAGTAGVTVPAPSDQVDGLGALYVNVTEADVAGPGFVFVGGGGATPINMGELYLTGGSYRGRAAIPWYVGTDTDVTVELSGATTGTLVVTYVYPV